VWIFLRVAAPNRKMASLACDFSLSYRVVTSIHIYT
jgi:hypothetical protein